MSTPPSSPGPKGPAKLLSKNPSLGMGLFTAGALATAAWMIKDSYIGNKELINNQVADYKQNNDMRLAEFDWGRYSGQPGMDGLSRKWFGLKQYGPYSLREKFRELKIRVSTFFSNVIVPNLIPLGLGIAGLYGTFGAKTLHKPFVAAGKALCKVKLPTQLKRDLGRAFTKVGGHLASGLGKVARWPFQSLGNLGIASGLAFDSAFFLKRFNDNYSGDAQRQWLRDDLFSPNMKR